MLFTLAYIKSSTIVSCNIWGKNAMSAQIEGVSVRSGNGAQS